MVIGPGAMIDLEVESLGRRIPISEGSWTKPELSCSSSPTHTSYLH